MRRASNEKKGKWAGPGGSLVLTPLRWGLEAVVEAAGGCGSLLQMGSVSEPGVFPVTAQLPGPGSLLAQLEVWPSFCGV